MPGGESSGWFEEPSRGAGSRGRPAGDERDEFEEREFEAEPPEQHAREEPTEFIHLVDDDFEDDFLDEYAEYEEERAEPEYIEPGDGPEKSSRKPRRRRRRLAGWVAALVVIVLIGGGAWYGIKEFFGYADFEGTGESDVVIQIGEGYSTNAIGNELAKAGVVASAKAFVKASAGNSKVLSLQPGYYLVKTKMSGAAAVEMLTSGQARVGVLQIRAGTQLDDITQPDGTVTPGVFTLLSKASCATLNGQSTCVPVAELRRVAQTGDLAAMGVPDWAVSAIADNTDARRIEGLIAPGVYDVKPGWDAAEVLGYVLTASAKKIQAAGLGPSSTVDGQNAYQLLIIASLIEREGVKQDFEKISRVIYNRLSEGMRLQFDSTVNYLLDKPVITTQESDRARPGPYNTYQNTGLTPTPISSPSPDAIKAALHPADGDYLFFVKCEKNGLSCFAATRAEHNRNVETARANGAF